MGNADRTFRILAAIAIVISFFIGNISGTVAIVLLIIAALFLLTSVISFCPLYWPFHISTKTREKENPDTD